MDGLTVEEDLTMRRRQDAVQASQQRALAGAIGADERGRLTGMEIQADVFERRSILEVDAQAHGLHARRDGVAQPGLDRVFELKREEMTVAVIAGTASRSEVERFIRGADTNRRCLSIVKCSELEAHGE